jgi:hypothetical protein
VYFSDKVEKPDKPQTKIKLWRMGFARLGIITTDTLTVCNIAFPHQQYLR